MFISTDDGEHWNFIGLQHAYVNAMQFDSSLLFVGTSDSGLFYSSDSGTHWSELNRGFPNNDVSCIGVGDTSEFVQTGGGAFISNDSGVTWNSWYGPTPFVGFVAFSNSYVTDLFIANTYGVGRSTDNGQSWLNTELGYPLTYHVTSLAVDGPILLAGTDSGGVYLSDDQGNSWVSSGYLIDTPISAVAVIGNQVFVAFQNKGVFLSTDSGASWHSVSAGIEDTTITALADIQNNLFAATENHGVYLSTNDGTSWSAVNTGLHDSTVLTLAIDGPYLLAGTEGNSIWKRPLSQMVTLGVPAHNLIASSIQCYPNPFTHSTHITFTTEAAGYTDVSIVNLLGTEVAHLFSGTLGAGEHSFNWDAAGTAAPRGVYECVVRTAGHVQTVPIVLAR